MKMCSCADCVFWISEDQAEGNCAYRAPTVVVIGDHITTVMPLTTSDTHCADGWDGKPSEHQKMAQAYMQSQMQELDS